MFWKILRCSFCSAPVYFKLLQKPCVRREKYISKDFVEFFCFQIYVLRRRRQNNNTNNTHNVGDGNLSMLWHSMKTLVKNLWILNKPCLLKFGSFETWMQFTAVKFQLFIYRHKVLLARGSIWPICRNWIRDLAKLWSP